MDFQGYALGVATILLVAYVVPYLYRRRTVLSDARIEERYAEDLRMLNVTASRMGVANGHDEGSHGTVFFRQPEVIMSQSDRARIKKAASAQVGSPSDVRALAKERARRRARISKRTANRQRGILGLGAAIVLGVVLWVLVGVASLPAVVAGIGTAIGLLYAAGLGYVVNAMSQATATDEAAITTIDRKLKSSKGAAHLARSRRPVAPRTAHHPVNARPEASKPRNTAESGKAVQTGGQETANRVVTNSDMQAERSAEESVDRILGRQVDDEPKVSAQWPKTSSSHASNKPARSGLAMSVEPEIIEDSEEVELISTEDSANRSSVSSARSTTTSPTTGSAPEGTSMVADDEDAGAGDSETSRATRPRQIERRVVTPYEAPPEPEAAVPYRPKDVGERFDEELEAGDEKDGTDGLTGGSALDALLDRRRA